MIKEKKSFFERLAGSINVDDDEEIVDIVRGRCTTSRAACA
jgi:hypothetical protein